MRFGAGVIGGLMAVACAVTALAAAEPAEPAVTPQAAEFFETHVRPVLAERCFNCHGEKTQMAGLRLDSRAALLKGSESGLVVVAGDPEKSSLIHAIRYDGKVKMPPTGKLPATAIDVLTTWVKMGAPWPDSPAVAASAAGRDKNGFTEAQRKHWAFQPVNQPPIPAVKSTTWPISPIDRFILAKLEQKGMKPSPAADRRALIRRATFDLIGLPPTADEVAAFVTDRSPNAFAKVVDRLLASPRYGERWGRYWLDVARYADTKGYVFEEERRYPYAYTYRDYVIRAFNEDLPYDQFLIQQLAADQLPLGEDKRPLAAMGFVTLGRRFLNNQPDIIDDRIDVVTRGTMALTVSCARCHDHKFDPIPTKDYYSLYGVFASSREPKDPPLLAPPARSAAYLAYEKELKAREDEITRLRETQVAERLTALRAQGADYLIAAYDARKREGDEGLASLAHSRDLNPMVLRRWQNFLEETSKAPHPVFGPWHLFAALPEAEFAAKAPDLAARVAANADPQARVNPLVAKAFAGPPPASMREVAQRYGALLVEADRLWQEALKAHREVAAKAGENPPPAPTALPDADQEALRQVLYAREGPTNVPPDEVERLLDRAARSKLQALRRKVDELRATSPAAPPRAMALEDLPTPQEPRVFLRGNPNNPGDRIPRQFLLVLAGDQRQPFRQGSGRLELARAIASKSNPLTARVFVNRVWLHHFGAGLVRTPSDFGMRSDPPSHPELLDYLAWRFMEQGWSIKKLHRLIMLSRTYQQSSDDNPRYHRADPENLLVWRANRQRLDFEATRDALLAVTGQLDLNAGGTAVDLTAAPFSHRRTVYGFIDRQNLPGLFRTFDFASPDSSSPQRFTTTVPQQALFMMNSPFVVEQARHLVSRPEVASRSNDAERIQRLYRLIYGRSAEPEEVSLGRRFLEAQVHVPPPPAPEPPVWQYGFGEYDEATQRVKSFQPLRWTGEVWQGGKEFPDPELGFLRLTATGGHPGNDRQHAVIRRWVAPRDAIVSLAGTVRHPNKEGDGVQARIVCSRTGELGRWTTREGQAETAVARVEVKRGDTIDFIVDCRDNPDSDSFRWAPVVRLAASAAPSSQLPAPGPAAAAASRSDKPEAAAVTPISNLRAQSRRSEATTEWDANTGFGGPVSEPPKPLNAWEKYTQVLLLANEFVFVD